MLVITGASILTESRPATSRPPYVVPNSIATGDSSVALAATAAANAGPGSPLSRSPVVSILVAPCS